MACKCWRFNKEDDPILEISTDKVDTEVPSPFSGTVSALLVEEGETVEVGSPLLELDGENSLKMLQMTRMMRLKRL